MAYIHYYNIATNLHKYIMYTFGVSSVADFILVSRRLYGSNWFIYYNIHDCWCIMMIAYYTCIYIAKLKVWFTVTGGSSASIYSIRYGIIYYTCAIIAVIYIIIAVQISFLMCLYDNIIVYIGIYCLKRRKICLKITIANS